VKFHKIAFVLLLIGGLNWLLVGLFQKDVFVMLGMDMSGTVARIVYVLVGVSAVAEIISHKSVCRMCKPEGMKM
jgi:uncharacterized membrane protein YuzA (DUF378 family)